MIEKKTTESQAIFPAFSVKATNPSHYNYLRCFVEPPSPPTNEFMQRKYEANNSDRFRFCTFIHESAIIDDK